MVQECTRKELLTAEIRTVMDEIVALEAHQQEVAGAGNSAEIPLIQTRLHEARQRKDALLQEYEQHVRTHGCQAPSNHFN